MRQLTLVTVAAGDGGGVARLGALFGDVALLTAVATCVTAAVGTVFGKVAGYRDELVLTLMSGVERHSLSLQRLHSTPSAERGSVQSVARWPDCLQLRQAFGSSRGFRQSRRRWPASLQLVQVMLG